MVRTVRKTVTTLLVSATMALPGPLWAMEGSSSLAPADAKDGVPVLFEQATLPNGASAILEMAPVSQSEERTLVPQLARENPSGLWLSVAGAGDPVLKDVRKTGNLGSVHTYLMSSEEDAPVVRSSAVPYSFRQKIATKMRAITDFCKREKKGLMTALYVSSLSTGYVMYETSSVEPGLTAMIGLLGWATFQGVFTHSWEKYLMGGGSFLHNSLDKIHCWFGRQVNAAQKRLYQVSGMFAASWLANSAVDAYVFFQAGTLSSLPEVLWYGFLSANDILDAIVLEKVRSGAVSAKFFKRFVLARILAGPIFDIATWINVPDVQLILGSITAGGLMYLAFGRLLEKKYGPSLASVHATMAERCSALLQRRPNEGVN